MLKKVALLLALLMAVYLVLVFGGFPYPVSVRLDGHVLHGPIGLIGGVLEFVTVSVVLFCVAILLAFVFAGVGLVVLGSLVLAGVVVVCVTLPLTWPILVPLFVIWLFCALAKSG